MANDDLVGNMDTERIIGYLKQKELLPALNEDALQHSFMLAEEIFRTY
jgi:hydroxymethylglutaryl-CoA lyase